MPIPELKIETPEVDDLGYVIPESEKAAPIVEDKKEETPAAEEPDNTGYTKKEETPAAEEVKPPVVDDKKPEELTEEEKIKKEFTEVVKDLSEGYNKDKISKFALDNKFTKEQLSAYVSQIKADDAEMMKQQKEAVASQRKSWKEELVKDPEFGGENFDKNVDRVNKVLNNMSNTKKMLTEKGTMLPPYIMKDLLGLSKLLNPTTKFVGGEPPAPEEQTGNFLDDLYK